MEKIHKDALRKARSKIVKDMDLDSELWDLLGERNIFTPIMLEYIQAEKTRTSKNRKLLDDLVRRGPMAYHSFLSCLRDSQHGHLADEIVKKEQELGGGNFVPSDPSVVVTTTTETSGGVLSVSNVSGVSSIPMSRQPAEQNESVSGVSGVLSSGQTTDQDMEVADAPVPVVTSVDVVGSVGASGVVAHPEDDHHMVATVGLGEATTRLPGASVYQTVDESRRYRMESDPRGHCLIINNRDFVDMDKREGTDKNRDDLIQLFTDLGFELTVQNNLIAEDMKKWIWEFAKFEGLRQVDAVAIILLSHGDNSVIYGTDGEELSLKDDIFVPFAQHSAKYTINKPKIFIVNACRGVQDDAGVCQDGQRRSTNNDVNTNLNSDALDLQQDAKRFSDGQRTATLKDMFVAYSTCDGFTSYRVGDLGSMFIEKLVEVFREEAATSEINSMMIEVNNRMSNWNSAIQIPNPNFTLTKKLFFNPPARTWNHLV